MGDISPSISDDDDDFPAVSFGDEHEDEQQEEEADLNSLRVMARIRPPATEEEQTGDDCLHVSEDHSSITLRSMKAAPKGWQETGQALIQEFKCETYLDATQREFSRAARIDKYINLAFDGYNCTIFAYGETGSGKTYTIFGSTPGLADAKYRGIMRRRRASMTMQEHGPANTLSDFGLAPLAVKRLFEILDMKVAMQLGEEAGVVTNKRGNGPSKESYDYKVSISMVEIYNEQIQDLLTGLGNSQESEENNAKKKKPQRRSSITEQTSKDRTANNDSKAPRLNIRYNSLRGDYFVQGAECLAVQDAQEAIGFIEHGLTNRVYTQHNLNERSSRGHCLLTFYVDAVPQSHSSGGANKDSEAARYGKLLFVDLAGSEDLKSTGVKGEQAKETASINKSMFALGKLVDAVSREQKKTAAKQQQTTTTAYRDSKLTMLMRDCLGGNSCTLMVACIAPTDEHGPESLRTLRFMARASEVKNVAKAHVSPKDELIEQLREQIRKLKKENEALRQGKGVQIADKESPSEGSRGSRQQAPTGSKGTPSFSSDGNKVGYAPSKGSKGSPSLSSGRNQDGDASSKGSKGTPSLSSGRNQEGNASSKGSKETPSLNSGRNKNNKASSKGSKVSPSSSSGRNQDVDGSFRSTGSPIVKRSNPESHRPSPGNDVRAAKGGKATTRSPRTDPDAKQYQTLSEVRKTARQEAENDNTSGMSFDGPGSELPEVMNAPRKTSRFVKGQNHAGRKKGKSAGASSSKNQSPRQPDLKRADHQSPRHPDHKPPRSDEKPPHSGRRLKPMDTTGSSSPRGMETNSKAGNTNAAPIPEDNGDTNEQQPTDTIARLPVRSSSTRRRHGRSNREGRDDTAEATFNRPTEQQPTSTSSRSAKKSEDNRSSPAVRYEGPETDIYKGPDAEAIFNGPIEQQPISPSSHSAKKSKDNRSSPAAHYEGPDAEDMFNGRTEQQPASTSSRSPENFEDDRSSPKAHYEGPDAEVQEDVDAEMMSEGSARSSQQQEYSEDEEHRDQGGLDIDASFLDRLEEQINSSPSFLDRQFNG